MKTVTTKMNDKNLMANTLLIVSCVLIPGMLSAGLYGDLPDATHAWSVHDMNRPKPVKVEVGANGVPSDAVVLFDGTKASFEKNWCDDKGNPSQWGYSEEGFFYVDPKWRPGGACAIYSRAEFGDCQLHLEYRHEPKSIFTDKGSQMRGNSGVFLMGNYEIQILESYWTSQNAQGTPEYVDNCADGMGGAVYAENPPMVNPAKKPGEWKTYDIVFHQPVWKDGSLVHPGSITLFFNGVLVQDHWEMEGLTTHCHRRPLAPHPNKAALQLQDHGCVVQFRNIWYRPIPSRWDNVTCSIMSADPDKVMASRRETAERLYAKIANPTATDAKTIIALGEVISYANEGKYCASFWRALEAYRAKPGDRKEVDAINRALDVLVRGKVIPESAKIAVPGTDPAKPL